MPRIEISWNHAKEETWIMRSLGDLHHTFLTKTLNSFERGVQWCARTHVPGGWPELASKWWHVGIGDCELLTIPYTSAQGLRSETPWLRLNPSASTGMKVAVSSTDWTFSEQPWRVASYTWPHRSKHCTYTTSNLINQIIVYSSCALWLMSQTHQQRANKQWPAWIK